MVACIGERRVGWKAGSSFALFCARKVTMEPCFHGDASAFHKGGVPILTSVGRWKAACVRTSETLFVAARFSFARLIAVESEPDPFPRADFRQPRCPAANGGD